MEVPAPTVMNTDKSLTNNRDLSQTNETNTSIPTITPFSGIPSFMKNNNNQMMKNKDKETSTTTTSKVNDIIASSDLNELPIMNKPVQLQIEQERQPRKRSKHKHNNKFDKKLYDTNSDNYHFQNSHYNYADEYDQKNKHYDSDQEEDDEDDDEEDDDEEEDDDDDDEYEE